MSPFLPIHPNVPQYQEFKYKGGKPDRVKKVLRFFKQEEERIIKMAVEEEEIVKEVKTSGKIYFGTIKSRVPKLI